MADQILDQINMAKANDYSTDEIVDYLASSHPDLAEQINTAKSNNYSSADILDHLQTQHIKAIAKPRSFLGDISDAFKTGIAGKLDISNVPNEKAVATTIGGLPGAAVGEVGRLVSPLFKPSEYNQTLENTGKDIVNFIPSMYNVVKTALTGTPEQQYENAKGVLNSAINNPIMTTATIAGGASEMSGVRAAAPLATGEGASMIAPKNTVIPTEKAFIEPPPYVKPTAEVTGVMKGFRDIPNSARVLSEGIKQGTRAIGENMGQKIDDIAMANPEKIIPLNNYISELATTQDPASLSIIARTPKLRELIAKLDNGDDISLTLKEAQDLKNQITGRIAEGKKSGTKVVRTDLDALDMATDLGKSILENIPEMKPVYDEFSGRINQAKLVRNYRNPKSAEEFLKNGISDTELQAIENTVPTDVGKFVNRFKKIGNIGIPDTVPLIGKLGLNVRGIAGLGKSYGKPTNPTLLDTLQKINSGSSTGSTSIRGK